MEDELRSRCYKAMFNLKRIRIPPPPGVDCPPGEMMALHKLGMHGPRPEVPDAADIQHALNVSRPAVSQLFNSLERKGYIKREIHPSDRRKINVSLTVKGMEEMEKMRLHFDRVFDEIVNRLGDEDTRKLISISERLIEISSEIACEIEAEPNKSAKEEN